MKPSIPILICAAFPALLLGQDSDTPPEEPESTRKALEVLAINQQKTDPFGLYQKPEYIPKRPVRPVKPKPTTPTSKPGPVAPRGPVGSPDAAFARIKITSYDLRTKQITLGNGLSIPLNGTLTGYDEKRPFKFKYVGADGGFLLFDGPNNKRYKRERPN